MPRKAREKSPLETYHVVIKGADHRIIFEETRDYKKYIDILDYYREECEFDLYAYCLMSNHVHLLIHTNKDSIGTVFRKINTKYAGWFNAKYNRSGYLQDGRYFSEPVNSSDYLLAALRYIHFNPTKAGLEEYPGQKYPWSSYNEFFVPNPPLINSEFVLSQFSGLDDFVNFHKDYPIEDFLDVEKTHKHLPDDVAKNIICDISGCSTSIDFQELSQRARADYIRQIHKKGVSIRQLNRLTGTPKGIIERILR